MDTRVAVISIIVEDNNSIETLNQLLYDARDHIIGHRISSVLFQARLAD